jgi:hypothetical protein
MESGKVGDAVGVTVDCVIVKEGVKEFVDEGKVLFGGLSLLLKGWIGTVHLS